MSEWPKLALILGLLLLSGNASALKASSASAATVAVRETSSAATSEWWYRILPLGGVLKVYDLNDDLFPEAKSHHASASHFPEAMGAMSLLSESTEETRVSANNTAASVAAGHTNAAGAGAGLGQTDGAIKFAGTTATAAKKLAANASINNALVVNAAKAEAKSAVRGAQAQEGAGHAKTNTPIAAIGWMMWIRASMSIGFCVKSMCMLCNMFYQASPLPIISDYNLKGDTGDADLAPYLATAYSGWQWCYYGMFAYIVTGKSGFLVLVYSNVVGATLGIYYVYAFTLNCKNKAMIQRTPKYFYVLFFLAGVQFCALLLLPTVKALFFSGLISSAWSTITSCSLLATVPIVYETKNSKTLPFPLLVMGEVSAVLWIGCGVMLWDPWITFPNILALGVCGYALYLCYLFPVREDCGDHTPDYEESEEVIHVPEDMDQNASPLQRALGLYSRSSSENRLLQETREKARMYGATGGTGDSF